MTVKAKGRGDGTPTRKPTAAELLEGATGLPWTSAIAEWDASIRSELHPERKTAITNAVLARLATADEVLAVLDALELLHGHTMAPSQKRIFLHELFNDGKMPLYRLYCAARRAANELRMFPTMSDLKWVEPGGPYDTAKGERVNAGPRRG